MDGGRGEAMVNGSEDEAGKARAGRGSAERDRG